METLNRLKGWLGNPANTLDRRKMVALDEDFVLRKSFVTANGITISIQMSVAHSCKVDESVEMWHCPPNPLLMLYGDGQDPYAHVPLDVVAGYIDSLESLGENHDYN